MIDGVIVANLLESIDAARLRTLLWEVLEVEDQLGLTVTDRRVA